MNYRRPVALAAVGIVAIIVGLSVAHDSAPLVLAFGAFMLGTAILSAKR